MQRKYIAAMFLLLIGLAAQAQRVFLVPSYFHGIFSDQLSSARAQGMGFTTITLDGISTSLYNPATIGPGNARLELALNYAKGSPQFPKSNYPFAGISYKIHPRITIGASLFAWKDPDSYWTATIQSQDVETDKKSQHIYSVLAAGELIKGLQLGVSGNFLRGSSVNGTTTSKDFLLNTGLIYDRSLRIINHPRLTNQSLRVALSLTNTLMKALSEEKYQNLLNYRDLPIILRAGAAYRFSIPASVDFAKRSKFFSDQPEVLDLALRLQYQDWLKNKDFNFNDNKYSTAFGIGAEAWFMKMIALRLGYYSETRPEHHNNDIVVTAPKKEGFTWGFGANLPLQRFSSGKLPLELEVNFVTQRMMNELIDKYVPTGSDFRDRRFQFCMGVNVRWKK